VYLNKTSFILENTSKLIYNSFLEKKLVGCFSLLLFTPFFQLFGFFDIFFTFMVIKHHRYDEKIRIWPRNWKLWNFKTGERTVRWFSHSASVIWFLESGKSNQKFFKKTGVSKFIYSCKDAFWGHVWMKNIYFFTLNKFNFLIC
jgi:hypothetical protein